MLYCIVFKFYYVWDFILGIIVFIEYKRIYINVIMLNNETLKL